MRSDVEANNSDGRRSDEHSDVASDGCPRSSTEFMRDDTECWNDDHINFRMSKVPEQMVKQNRVTS